MYLLRVLYAACILTISTANASAQSWPNRPIKLVVPTGPGSATDVMARLLAEGIGRNLGQPVFVENIGGASGIVAHQTVARAEPDGHTILFTNTSGMASNLVSFKQLPYSPQRDFTPIAMVCDLGPQLLSVSTSLPVSSFSEFLTFAGARRGTLSVGFDTTAGAAAYAVKLFNRRSKLQLVEVPYKSAAQMSQDVAAGINQVMLSSIVAARSLIEGGKVRPLAVTSAARFPGLPDLPTVDELIPGVVMNGWFAVVAPAGTPAPAIASLNNQIDSYLKQPDIQKRLLSFGLSTQGAGTPDTTATFIKNEQATWERLGRELQLEAQ